MKMKMVVPHAADHRVLLVGSGTAGRTGERGAMEGRPVPSLRILQLWCNVTVTLSSPGLMCVSCYVTLSSPSLMCTTLRNDKLAKLIEEYNALVTC